MTYHSIFKFKLSLFSFIIHVHFLPLLSFNFLPLTVFPIYRSATTDSVLPNFPTACQCVVLNTRHVAKTQFLSTLLVSLKLTKKNHTYRDPFWGNVCEITQKTISRRNSVSHVDILWMLQQAVKLCRGKKLQFSTPEETLERNIRSSDIMSHVSSFVQHQIYKSFQLTCQDSGLKVWKWQHNIYTDIISNKDAGYRPCGGLAACPGCTLPFYSMAPTPPPPWISWFEKWLNELNAHKLFTTIVKTNMFWEKWIFSRFDRRD